MALLTEIQEDIQRVAARVGPTVVGVGQRWGAGSGVVVAPGRVLTNAHNLRTEPVVVTFADGRTADGQVRGLDVDADVAVIDVDTGASEAIEWAAEAAPGIGTPVFAAANPGGRGLRVTLGFVTGVQRSFRGPRGRRITGSIEHDAALLPGSSGGPVVTAEGQAARGGRAARPAGGGRQPSVARGPGFRRPDRGRGRASRQRNRRPVRGPRFCARRPGGADRPPGRRGASRRGECRPDLRCLTASRFSSSAAPGPSAAGWSANWWDAARRYVPSYAKAVTRPA
jgi:Trypsin-like peptidase domain